MNYQEFASQLPIQRCLPDDLKKYTNFITKNSMKASYLSVNILREQNIYKSFEMQGLSPHPYFILDKQGHNCGFFAVSSKQGIINQKPIEFGYLSDLRLDSSRSMAGLKVFRSMYQDFMKNYNTIDEFRSVKFFLTAILDENEKALQSLTRGRSDVIYNKISSYTTRAIFIHPLYLKKPSLDFEFILAGHNVTSEGLCDNKQTIQAATTLSFSISYKGEIALSANLCRDLLRSIHVGFTPIQSIHKSLKSHWLTQLWISPKIDAYILTHSLRYLIYELVKQKMLKPGGLLLYKEGTLIPDLHLSKKFPASIYEVYHSNHSSYFTDNLTEINLEPAFL